MRVRLNATAAGLARETGAVLRMARSGAGATNQRALIDAAYLDRLEATLGADGLGELLADGMIELSDRIHTLDDLARAGERAAVAAFAHDIVAVAGHMGLGALSAAAAELCRALREDPHAGTDGGLSAITAPVVAIAKPSIDALAKRHGGGAASA